MEPRWTPNSGRWSPSGTPKAPDPVQLTPKRAGTGADPAWRWAGAGEKKFGRWASAPEAGGPDGTDRAPNSALTGAGATGLEALMEG